MGENLNEVPLDEEKDKIKDVPSSENLFEVLEEGEVDFPFMSLSSEKYSILIEDTVVVNLRTEENPKIAYIASSLDEKEKESMTTFLKKTHINFASRLKKIFLD